MSHQRDEGVDVDQDVPVELYRRAMRMLHIPDRPGVKGSTIKLVVTQLMEYADYSDGRNARPGLSTLAVVCSLTQRTTGLALQAAQELRLIELVEDNRGTDRANAYRLLNPALSPVWLEPEEFEALVTQQEEREKRRGTRRLRPVEGPGPVPVAGVDDGESGGSEGRKWGKSGAQVGEVRGESGGSHFPPPIHDLLNDLLTDHPDLINMGVGNGTYDRARDGSTPHLMIVSEEAEDPPGRDSEEIRERALGAAAAWRRPSRQSAPGRSVRDELDEWLKRRQREGLGPGE